MKVTIQQSAYHNKFKLIKQNLIKKMVNKKFPNIYILQARVDCYVPTELFAFDCIKNDVILRLQTVDRRKMHVNVICWIDSLR